MSPEKQGWRGNGPLTGGGLNGATELRVDRGRGSQGAGTRLAQRGGVCLGRCASIQCTGIGASEREFDGERSGGAVRDKVRMGEVRYPDLGQAPWMQLGGSPAGPATRPHRCLPR